MCCRFLQFPGDTQSLKSNTIETSPASRGEAHSSLGSHFYWQDVEAVNGGHPHQRCYFVDLPYSCDALLFIASISRGMVGGRDVTALRRNSSRY
jgi:hypothetical protein